jgi:hypothetical protein
MNNKTMDIMEMVSIKSMVNNFKVNKNICGCVRTKFIEKTEQMCYELVSLSNFPDEEEIERFFKDLSILQRITPGSMPRYVLNIYNEETRVISYFSVFDDMILLCDTDFINDTIDFYHMTFDIDPKMYTESLTVASTIYEFLSL